MTALPLQMTGRTPIAATERQTEAEQIDGLIAQARQGDTGAFESLYRLHVNRVYALCLRMTADAEKAKELTQDAFVRAWNKLDTYRAESAFGTWLHRLTVNVVLLEMRSQARRMAREFVTDDLGRHETAAAAMPAGLDVDLERAIAGLPPAARSVLILHDVEGYRHHEIGQMLGVATGTSKAHLHRARRLVREALER